MTVTKDAISIARTIRLGFFKSVRPANSGFSPCNRRANSDVESALNSLRSFGSGGATSSNPWVIASGKARSRQQRSHFSYGNEYRLRPRARAREILLPTFHRLTRFGR